VNVPLPENSLGGHKVKNQRMNPGRSISGFDRTGFVGILFQIVAMLADKGMR
jgi:hypothetical protein